MFYMDHPNANENYSEFIGKELVKITRRMFPLSHKKEDTFIAGLSMGGYGAIRNGLKYHDTFGYIAGLSSAMILEKMRTADDSSPMFFEKKSFLENVFGDLSRIKDCEINPEWIAENMKKDGIPFPHMYLACGLDDPLLPPNRKFRALDLRSLKFAHQLLPGVCSSIRVVHGLQDHDRVLHDLLLQMAQV